MNVSEVKALLEKVRTSSLERASAKQSLDELPKASADEAAVVQLSNNPYTLSKLERHLRDDARGEGYKSRDGYGYTLQRENQALNKLAEDDVAGFNFATRFLSDQSNYGIRVRAVEGIRQAAVTSTQLRKLAAQLNDLKK